MKNKTAPGPFTGPYEFKLPPMSLEEALSKFSGQRSPDTYAAAKRLQSQPRRLRVPRHLMNHLWQLTGGWKDKLVRDWEKDRYPARTMLFANSFVANHVPDWAKKARTGLYFGDLELCFVPSFSRPELFLRWQGWIFGRIDDKDWTNDKTVNEVMASLCHKLTDVEVSSWGFLPAVEEKK